jgi:CRISPR-associated endonuclease/helicase Cas3
MCADLAGSALPKKAATEDQELRAWVRKRLLPILGEGQLKSVVKQKLKSSKPRDFQQRVLDAGTRTVLVEAGCGSGKTAAAYLWAEKHSISKRLFFCYPTTTTASEGFAGYLRDPDFEAILVNSRAEMDYRLLPGLPGKPRSQIEIERLHLEALETWPIPVVVCTAHTVLGLLQNERRGIYAWPSIARSAFVFDEVHSFSPRLFAHLLRFLEIFESFPVLLMTATLPPGKKSEIDRICRYRGGLSVVGGPEDRESAGRYALKCVDVETAYRETRDMILEGGKVLWVSNTVVGAMALARRALDDGLPVQPFHSRYRYRDRVQRQMAVVRGFQPGAPPMLAVTTQVAEMSLDLSADLLVSEYAPPASMIQRLGRLNRFEDVPTKERLALFYKPPSALPYAKGKEEKELWGKVDNWFDIVADGTPKSQKDLASAFTSAEERFTPQTPARVHCDWIDDPPVSLSHRNSLMEPGHTVEMVRGEDLKSGPVDEMVIPMPFPKGDSWQKWPTKGRYIVAPSGIIRYDIFWGASYAESQPEDWII